MKDINSFRKHSYKFSAIKSGLIQRSINPGLIKIVKLEKYLKYCNNLHSLCRTIVYSMLNEVSERSTEEWILTFNSFPKKKLEFWKNIALYSKVKIPRSFEDLILIDYSILTKPEKEEFLRKYSQVKDILLLELKLMGKGR